MRARGMALVTVLLVLAIASLAATALLTSANLSIHRMAVMRDSEEAWWVALGVEAWVQGILKDDASKSSYDGLDEAWAQPVDYLPIDQGHVSGRLVDLQGLFNLNDLAPVNLNQNQPGNPRQNTQAMALQVFRQLLLEVAPDAPADDIIAAIIDWLDPDQNATFPRGAEDTAYMTLDPPYRAANRLFTVPSELLAIQGVTPKIYDALAPFVTALPVTGQAINVNTAPVEVLVAMAGGPSSSGGAKAQAFDRQRREKPEQTKAQFDADYPGMFPAGVAYDVRTSFFQIRGDVFVGSSRVGLYSLIYRGGNGTAIVIAHSADPE